MNMKKLFKKKVKVELPPKIVITSEIIYVVIAFCVIVFSTLVLTMIANNGNWIVEHFGALPSIIFTGIVSAIAGTVAVLIILKDRTTKSLIGYVVASILILGMAIQSMNSLWFDDLISFLLIK